MFGLEVPANSEIGEGFVITHTVGTVLGAKSIGQNVTIYHQVTIGSASIKNSNTLPRPVIGDDVILYVGSKILGDIKIGKGVVVGANSVVLKSIPDYHIAYGVPAKYKTINENSY
jgi:serine O-acetyltransferase